MPKVLRDRIIVDEAQLVLKLEARLIYTKGRSCHLTKRTTEFWSYLLAATWIVGMVKWNYHIQGFYPAGRHEESKPESDQGIEHLDAFYA